MRYIVKTDYFESEPLFDMLAVLDWLKNYFGVDGSAFLSYVIDPAFDSLYTVYFSRVDSGISFYGISIPPLRVPVQVIPVQYCDFAHEWLPVSSFY